MVRPVASLFETPAHTVTRRQESPPARESERSPIHGTPTRPIPSPQPATFTMEDSPMTFHPYRLVRLSGLAIVAGFVLSYLVAFGV